MEAVVPQQWDSVGICSQQQAANTVQSSLKLWPFLKFLEQGLCQLPLPKQSMFRLQLQN